MKEFHTAYSVLFKKQEQYNTKIEMEYWTQQNWLSKT